MKTITRALVLALGLAVMASCCAFAQEGMPETPAQSVKKGKKAKKTGKAGRVAAALKKIKTFNGKPNAKALVYLFLQSASWCPPCNREMPTIVDTYKKMKKDGRVEIILLGHDDTVDAAKGFLKKYKAQFPGVLATGKNVDKLPGFSMESSIPHAAFVDADGNVLASGHPSSILSSWKSLADKAEEAATHGDAPAEDAFAGGSDGEE